MKARTLALLAASAYALYRISQRTGMPAGVRPVEPFDLDRYLGRWYEIARIDHAYEAGLTDTSADYRLRPDGRVQVINRGFNARKSRWRELRAIAEPAGDANVGRLLLSPLWPMRASYVVLALDDDYQHALVSGPTHDHLWLLARTPRIRASHRAALLESARTAGFDTERLLWVDQRRNIAREVTWRSET
ncbi:MAG: lipocalin family protein [Burkholderiales bacterium]|nr:lipocalin family protein [Burkholderiales bacterium]